ncbi:MAG TPA: efflux RND transporter periplasmic adaptor subunit [Thermoanaerobaculia bacterium]|nr:efflux RND transporter periplasmic adaptor subunit [Thermoanaerobaculia bacterium]
MKKALLTGFLLFAGAVGVARGEDKSYASHLMVDQEVVVSSRIGGIVETIAVDRGSAVTAGQVLATLDPREADATVREAKEDMELAKAEFDRAQSLTASKVMSTADLDQKKAQYAVAVARWEKAKTLRDYTVIRAPFAGIVTEKYARIGQKVIEDKGEPLFKITAVEPLLARVYLPEEELLNVKLGERVDVVAERFPDAKTTGEVQFISPAVDPASGTFQVVVRVRREAARSVLRPGIAVRIRFTRAPAR